MNKIEKPPFLKRYKSREFLRWHVMLKRKQGYDYVPPIFPAFDDIPVKRIVAELASHIEAKPAGLAEVTDFGRWRDKKSTNSD